jgi:hypothetical protein
MRRAPRLGEPSACRETLETERTDSHFDSFSRRARELSARAFLDPDDTCWI